VNINKNMKIGASLIVVGFVGLLLTQGSCMNSNMMGDHRGNNEMMGGSGSMKEMMQQYMADQLPPPGLKPEHIPEPESESVKLLSEYCTQCHDLPAPGLHTAEEWPAVVSRMNNRMQMMTNRGMMNMMGSIQDPSESEIKLILSYLQKHSL